MLSTESRLTALRRTIGSSSGSRTTSLARPRIVVVHGATRARWRRGIAASRDRTTTGRRPISGSLHPSLTSCEAVGYTENTYGPPIGLTVAITLGTPTPVGPTIANFTYPVNGQTAVSTEDAFEWSPVPAAPSVPIHGWYDAGRKGSVRLRSPAAIPVQLQRTGDATWANPVRHDLHRARWRLEVPVRRLHRRPQPGVLHRAVHRPAQQPAQCRPDGDLHLVDNSQAQGYILVLGTTNLGTDVANSDVLPASLLSYTPPIMPPNATLHATLLTKVNGAFTRFQSVAFITGPLGAPFLTYPDGPQGIPGAWFNWAIRAQAQNYILVIGTTPLGSNLYNSGLLGTNNWADVPDLPIGKTLYATRPTKIQGAWYYQAVTFKI